MHPAPAATPQRSPAEGPPEDHGPAPRRSLCAPGVVERAKALARELKADHPDAAASLLEGLEDMFTVRRLGITGTLAKTLTTTNAVLVDDPDRPQRARNVKRWRDGERKKRWVAAGMLEAERSFRRVKGHRDLPKLLAALRSSRGSSAAPPEYADSAA
jgi:putative transposase